jgi:RNA polymerase sigma-70 factor (ECF subfamily)
MYRVETAARVGLDALRCAVLHAARLPGPVPALVPAVAGGSASASRRPAYLPSGADLAGLLMAEALGEAPTGGRSAPEDDRPACDDPDTTRLMALVDLARAGDCEAFGLLYDHYQGAVYRFLYYRVGSHALAEDLTSETFFRALRSMSGFKWQGRDFGAWLITIARNLVADHYKAGRTRLEMTTDDLSDHDTATAGPEDDVLATLTNEALLDSLRQLAQEQQECLVLRFLQGMSIAETAKILERSEGAVKQLQLRAVRNLAKLLPEGVR